MFNSIKGILTKKNLNSVFIDTGSIEWDISMPAKSIDKLGMIDSEVKVYTWLHHHQDGMVLYGFASDSERVLFLDLIKVNGVGPKQAMKILSGISAQELRVALENSDLDKIKSTPGVGQKTAQKILLALQGKLTSADDFDKAEATSEFNDVINSLVDMGFDKKQVKACVDSIVKSKGKLEESELFKSAIVALTTN